MNWYNECSKLAAKKHSWIAFIDLDEFMVILKQCALNDTTCLFHCGLQPGPACALAYTKNEGFLVDHPSAEADSNVATRTAVIASECECEHSAPWVCHMGMGRVHASIIPQQCPSNMLQFDWTRCDGAARCAACCAVLRGASNSTVRVQCRVHTMILRGVAAGGKLTRGRGC